MRPKSKKGAERFSLLPTFCKTKAVLLEIENRFREKIMINFYIGEEKFSFR